VWRKRAEGKREKRSEGRYIMEGIDGGVLESRVMRKGWRNEGRRCRRERV
jgi:hypothetical protein